MKDRNKPIIRDMVFNKYNGHCAYCGCKLNRESFAIDHIKAKLRGFPKWQLERDNLIKGLDNLENYNPSCHSCNSSKSTLSIEKWRYEISLKTGRLNRDISGFRLVKRFGLIKEIKKPVLFYFEKYNHE